MEGGTSMGKAKGENQGKKGKQEKEAKGRRGEGLSQIHTHDRMVSRELREAYKSTGK